MLWAPSCFESKKDFASLSTEQFRLGDTKQLSRACSHPHGHCSFSRPWWQALLLASPWSAVSCNVEPILGEKPKYPQRSVDWALSASLLSLPPSSPAAPGELGDAGTEQCRGWVCCFLQGLPSHHGLSLIPQRYRLIWYRTQTCHYSQLPSLWTPTPQSGYHGCGGRIPPHHLPLKRGALPGRVPTPALLSTGRSPCRWSRGPGRTGLRRPVSPRGPPGWCRGTCTNTQGNTILELDIPQDPTGASWASTPASSEETFLVGGCLLERVSRYSSQHFTLCEITFLSTRFTLLVEVV